MPQTWSQISIEIAGRVLKQTPINEQYVATKKIQKLLDEGHTEKEVAKIWNSSLGGLEKPLTKKGKNKFGVKFDTEQYSLKVLTAYAQE